MTVAVHTFKHWDAKTVLVSSHQGSEEKTVVYVLGNSKRQNWKHVYTAVTRGQSRVYIIAKSQVLNVTVQRQDIRRNTRLAGLVKDVIRDLGKTGDKFNTSKPSFSFHKSPESSQSPGPSGANKSTTIQSPGSYLKDTSGSNKSGLYNQNDCTDYCPTPPKLQKVRLPHSFYTL